MTIRMNSAPWGVAWSVIVRLWMSLPQKPWTFTSSPWVLKLLGDTFYVFQNPYISYYLETITFISHQVLVWIEGLGFLNTFCRTISVEWNKILLMNRRLLGFPGLASSQHQTTYSFSSAIFFLVKLLSCQPSLGTVLVGDHLMLSPFG